MSHCCLSLSVSLSFSLIFVSLYFDSLLSLSLSLSLSLLLALIWIRNETVWPIAVNDDSVTWCIYFLNWRCTLKSCWTMMLLSCVNFLMWAWNWPITFFRLWFSNSKKINLCLSASSCIFRCWRRSRWFSLFLSRLAGDLNIEKKHFTLLGPSWSTLLKTGVMLVLAQKKLQTDLSCIYYLWRRVGGFVVLAPGCSDVWGGSIYNKIMWDM